MPHYIIEYTRALEAEMSADQMLETAHACALASGQFGENDIKVRLMPTEQSLVGGISRSAIHVHLYLLSGRDADIKKALTQAVVTAFSERAPSAASISCNAIDMDRETYSKITRS